MTFLTFICQCPLYQRGVKNASKTWQDGNTALRKKVFVVIMRQFSTALSFEIILNFRNITVQAEGESGCEKEISKLQK